MLSVLSLCVSAAEFAHMTRCITNLTEHCGDRQQRQQYLRDHGLSSTQAEKLSEHTARAAVDRVLGSMTADEREAADKALGRLASEAQGWCGCRWLRQQHNAWHSRVVVGVVLAVNHP